MVKHIRYSLTLIALCAAFAGCAKFPCRDKTVFVEVPLVGVIGSADQLVLRFAIGSAAAKEETLSRGGKPGTESVQIDFPSGYTAGETLRVSVRALAGGTLVGVGEQMTTLAIGCTGVKITLSPPGEKKIGEACTTGECASGFCVDGVCCGTVCDGQCEACDVDGVEGTCSAVSGAPVGQRAACTGAGNPCGGMCDGSNRDACTFLTTSCRALGCAAGVITEAASCVDGECPAVVTRQCALGACQDATTCKTVVSFSAGSQHTCAALSDGTVYCWGDGTFSQLGQGADTVFKNVPTQVMGLTDIVEVAAGGNNTCARHQNGRVSCWGQNNTGATSGLTEPTSTPALVPAPALDIASLGLGVSHSCAVTTNNRAFCWGINDFGNLGIGSTMPGTTPTPQPVCAVGTNGSCNVANRAADVARIYGGDSHTCILRTSGQIACWGRNIAGQVGVMANMTYTNPTSINLAGPTAISMGLGTATSCIVTNQGTVRCWGSNSDGALGDPGAAASTYLQRTLKTNADGTMELLGVQSVSFSGTAGCALRNNGLWCWGRNGEGQHGNGTFDPTHPFAVPSLLTSGVQNVSAGAQHTCVQLGPDDLRCFGYNANGHLGNGDPTAMNSATAVPVKWF